MPTATVPPISSSTKIPRRSGNQSTLYEEMVKLRLWSADFCAFLWRRTERCTCTLAVVESLLASTDPAEHMILWTYGHARWFSGGSYCTGRDVMPKQDPCFKKFYNSLQVLTGVRGRKQVHSTPQLHSYKPLGYRVGYQGERCSSGGEAA